VSSFVLALPIPGIAGLRFRSPTEARGVARKHSLMRALTHLRTYALTCILSARSLRRRRSHFSSIDAITTYGNPDADEFSKARRIVHAGAQFLCSRASVAFSQPPAHAKIPAGGFRYPIAAGFLDLPLADTMNRLILEKLNESAR